MNRARRGQATVELALSILVFIPILLLGIYFAEVSALTLRVTQAAASALFDTTGFRMHRFDGPETAPAQYYPIDRIVDSAGRDPQTRANALYADFDGLSSSNGATTLKLAFTRSAALTVSCKPATLFRLPGGAGYDNIRLSYDPATDAMECQATGQLSPVMPQKFFQKGEGGFFREDMVRRTIIPVCAFGRAIGGSCQGSVPMALDDWALSGSKTALGGELQRCDADCGLNDSGQNQAFRAQVYRIYNAYNHSDVDHSEVADFIKTLFTGTDPGGDYAKNNAGVSPDSSAELCNADGCAPIQERDFRFIYIGEEGGGGAGPFNVKAHVPDDTMTTVNPDWEWQTTPATDGYETAYDDRGSCFLGNDCGSSLFTHP